MTDHPVDDVALTREIKERIEALRAARAWPWLARGSSLVEADAQGHVRWGRVDEDGEVHSVDGGDAVEVRAPDRKE